MNSKGTTENRVYLFKDLAAAYLSANPGALHGQRDVALAALADLAFVSCVMADGDDMDPDAIAARIRSGT